MAASFCSGLSSSHTRGAGRGAPAGPEVWNRCPRRTGPGRAGRPGPVPTRRNAALLPLLMSRDDVNPEVSGGRGDTRRVSAAGRAARPQLRVRRAAKEKRPLLKTQRRTMTSRAPVCYPLI